MVLFYIHPLCRERGIMELKVKVLELLTDERR